MYYILKKASRRTSSRVKVNYNNKRVAAMDAGKAAGEPPSVSERWSEESSSESPVRPKTPPKTSAPKPAPAEDQQVLWCPVDRSCRKSFASAFSLAQHLHSKHDMGWEAAEDLAEKWSAETANQASAAKAPEAAVKANATKLVLKTPVPH